MQSATDQIMSRADMKMNAILTDGSIAIKDAKKIINEAYENDQFNSTDLMFNHFIILPLWDNVTDNFKNNIK